MTDSKKDWEIITKDKDGKWKIIGVAWNRKDKEGVKMSLFKDGDRLVAYMVKPKPKKTQTQTQTTEEINEDDLPF